VTVPRGAENLGCEQVLRCVPIVVRHDLAALRHSPAQRRRRLGCQAVEGDVRGSQLDHARQVGCPVPLEAAGQREDQVDADVVDPGGS
jgi:hypothetical protein